MNSKHFIFGIFLIILTCAISVNAQSLNNSIAHVWTFDENTSTRVNDHISTKGLTATASTYWTQGVRGTSLNFSATGRYAVNSTGLMSGWTAGSISLWYNLESNTSTSQAIYQSTAGDGELQLRFDSGSFNYYIFNAALTPSPTILNNQGQWYNLVFTFNDTSNEVKVYQNGVLKNTSTPSFSIASVSQAFSVGGDSTGTYSTQNFKGKLDEIYVWQNRILNSSDVQQLYNNGTGTFYPFSATTSSSFNVTTSTVTTPIIALTPQSLQLNISYNGSINFTNASFFYDGTLYSPTKTITSGNISNDTYVVNFSTPNYNNGTSASAYWAYNITFTNGTILEANTSNQSQTILNLLAGNCTANVTANRVLNYSIKNVETSAAVSANSIFNFTLSYDNGLSQNFLLNYTGNSNPAICVYPSWVVTNYTVTASLSATGYAPNTYIANGQVSNTTNNINIYLTNSTSGTAITYNVVDSSELPLEGMTVQSFQYDVGTGTLTQVNSLVTDSDGQGVAFLILNQYFVRRIYDKSNNLVLTHGPQYLPTTTTSQTFIIGGNITTGLTDWITVYGLSCTVTNSTIPLGTTTTWNSTNANISNYCFNLFNVSGGNMVLFNQSCSTNQSGSLFLPAYNETSWLAFPTMEVNGSDTTFILWCGGESPLSFSTYAQTQPVFGVEGVFWALILLVLLMTIGFAGQGAEYISMLLIIGWTAVVSLFNLIPWGYATFIGIAAFLIVWIMGMRRERG